MLGLFLLFTIVPATPAGATEPCVSAASSHGLAILADGSLWAWGWNNNGQLGLGTHGYYEQHDTPVRVGTDLWKGVSTSIFHTLAVRADGSLWVWGSNEFYSVFGTGLGMPSRSDIPLRIGTDTDWVWVGAGRGFSFARKADGSLWGWGDRLVGPGWKLTTTFTQISPYVDWTVLSVYQLNVDGVFLAGIREDGSLWVVRQDSVERVGAESDWSDVSVGGYHFLAVKTNGTLWGWGYSVFWPGWTPRPKLLAQDSGWVAVAAGDAHSLGLKSDGSLVAWGDNQFGQCGAGNAIGSFVPVAGGPWVRPFAGDMSSFALDAGGALRAWGSNALGKLGIGTTAAFFAPVPARSPSRWKSIEAGGLFSVGIKHDDTLWLWGRNDGCQLGLGDRIDRLTPVQPLPGTKWRAVTAGSAYVLALRDDGTLWSWGRNSRGVLGRGTGHMGEVRCRPGRVTGSGWTRISAGNMHALALRDDGSLWAWGRNAEGQLGLGTADNQAHPRPLRIGAGWKDISAETESMGVKLNGTAWRWGVGVDYSSPAPSRIVSPLTGPLAGIARVMAGIGYNFTLSNRGVLRSWGTFGTDSVGDPYPTFIQGAIVPLPAGARSWSSASAGFKNGAAVASDGTLWAWGENDFGQLGIGVRGPFQAAPVRVGDEADWAAVDTKHFVTTPVASGQHTLALKSDGTLWGWGDNTYGQLGLGVAGCQRTPQRIVFAPQP